MLRFQYMGDNLKPRCRNNSQSFATNQSWITSIKTVIWSFYFSFLYKFKCIENALYKDLNEKVMNHFQFQVTGVHKRLLILRLLILWTEPPKVCYMLHWINSLEVKPGASPQFKVRSGAMWTQLGGRGIYFFFYNEWFSSLNESNENRCSCFETINRGSNLVILLSPLNERFCCVRRIPSFMMSLRNP